MCVCVCVVKHVCSSAEQCHSLSVIVVTSSCTASMSFASRVRYWQRRSSCCKAMAMRRDRLCMQLITDGSALAWRRWQTPSVSISCPLCKIILQAIWHEWKRGYYRLSLYMECLQFNQKYINCLQWPNLNIIFVLNVIILYMLCYVEYPITSLHFCFMALCNMPTKC